MALTADQTALLNNTIAGILGANSTNFNTVKSYIIDKVNNGTVSIKDITPVEQEEQGKVEPKDSTVTQQ